MGCKALQAKATYGRDCMSHFLILDNGRTTVTILLNKTKLMIILQVNCENTCYEV